MQRSKKAKMMLLLLFSFLCLLSMMIVFVSRSIGNQTKKEKNSMLFISLEPMTAEEEIFYQQLCTSETVVYYYNQYQIDIGSDLSLWDTSFDHKTPSEYRMELITKQREHDARIRAAASLYQLEHPGTFAELKASWEQENLQRNNSSLIYGPTQMDLLSYYNYVYGNCEGAIYQAIYDETNLLPEKQLKQFYDQMKPDEFGLSQTGTMMLYYPETEVSTANNSLWNTLIKSLQSQEFDLNRLSELCKVPITSKVVKVDGTIFSKEDDSMPILLEQIAGRKKGEVFLGMSPYSQNTYVCYRILSLDSLDKPPYEVSIIIVKALYSEQKMKQLLQAGN